MLPVRNRFRPNLLLPAQPSCVEIDQNWPIRREIVISPGFVFYAKFGLKGYLRHGIFLKISEKMYSFLLPFLMVYVEVPLLYLVLSSIYGIKYILKHSLFVNRQIIFSGEHFKSPQLSTLLPCISSNFSWFLAAYYWN